MPIPLAYFATAGLLGWVGYYFVKGKRKKVFISYYSKGDSNYKNMIIAWAKNNNFKLQLEDVSTDTNIKSKNTSYLKKRMKDQISEADYFVVFVGEDTHTREWVSWEIEKAKELDKPIIAIKENRSHKSPMALLKSNVTWVYGFSEEGIRKALES